MARRILTMVLLLGLVLSGVVLAGRLKNFPLPGNQQGYEPEQPIAFSHRLTTTLGGIVVNGAYDSFDLSFYAAWAAEASHTVPPTASYYAGHQLNAFRRYASV